MQKEFICEGKLLQISFFYDSRMKFSVNKLKKWIKVLSYILDKDLAKQLTATKPKVQRSFLNASLVGEYKIRKLNFSYRQKDKVTDVLSFPLQENIREAKVDNFTGEVELGDLFICKQVCEKQSRKFKITFEEELIHLFIHGYLHLCGYDHEINEKEEILMEKLESSLLQKFKLARQKES